MRNVTICMAYYENPKMLQRQYDNLRLLPEPIKQRLDLIVVDDGSPDSPAVPPNPSLGIRSFKLFRMLVDIPWNQDACRNLAVKHAEDGWLLLTDMDHIPPAKTLRHVVFTELEEASVYQFSRISEPGMDFFKIHPNSWLMTKAMYDKVGGYDERFAKIAEEQGWQDGVYGTDGAFKKGIMRLAFIKPFKSPLIRVPREVTPDASTTKYLRRTPEMDARRTLAAQMIRESGRIRPMTGLFPWSRVV